jgi:hypothetical protein
VRAIPVLFLAARPLPRAIAPTGGRLAAVAALALAYAIGIAGTPAAFAASKTVREAARSGAVSDSARRPAAKTAFDFGRVQHGPLFGHLPPAQENVELVSKLNLIHPATGQPVIAGQIADVAVHKGYAYLNSWDNATCQGGGTFVVDIRNPAAPQQVSFIPAAAPYYHGEGAHVISVDTPQFKGDLLAVNDETYGQNLTAPCSPTAKSGGFDLYDVSDPANPVTLVQGAGDRSSEGSEMQNPAIAAKSYHSVFVWQDGPRAYLVASDNQELADVDIFDITDPRIPEFIKDLDLLKLPQAADIVDEGAQGNTILHHDVVVKRVGATMRMLVSYWDGGYVQLNVDNPANPTFITDTDFDDADRLTGFDPPEGNAHEAEYSHDNQFILAADEDFAPFRLSSTITQAPHAGVSFDTAVSGAEPIPGGATLTGDTVFVGAGCPGTVPAPPAGVTIAVAERGVCPFQEKAEAIEAAGYEMGVIMNNSFGEGGGRCESLINMLIDPARVAIPVTFVGRASGLRILDAFDASTYACSGLATETPADTDVPAVGSAGLTIQLSSQHDGWGYAHLYDAETSDEIAAYAIPESLDDRYASGFGDLSIHELAADPSTNLAYASYYSGGLRVLRFSRAGGLEELGKFIDTNGNNFWGVEQFTDAAGNRLIATSDRDYGLYILKYTGPGAVLASAVAPAGRRVRPSSMFSFGKLKRLTIRKGRAIVTITVPGPGKAAGTLKAAVGRKSMTLAKTTKTAKAKGRLRLTFRVSAAKARLLRRTLARRPTRRTSGVLRVQFTPTGGKRRTRNKALSIGMR